MNEVWLTIHPLFTFPLRGYDCMACYQHHRTTNKGIVADSSSELWFSAPSHILLRHPNVITTVMVLSSYRIVPKHLIVSRIFCGSFESWKGERQHAKNDLIWMCTLMNSWSMWIVMFDNILCLFGPQWYFDTILQLFLFWIHSHILINVEV